MAEVGSGSKINFPVTGTNKLVPVKDNAAPAGAKQKYIDLADLQTEIDTKQDALGYTAENSTNKGASNGYAPLGSDSKVPSVYLPSYVDDILEYANFASLPGLGEAGKIYVTLDTNQQYRWSGSAYIQLVASPGTTDALTEGSTNLYFTGARVLATVIDGFSAAIGVVANTDSILVAINKIVGKLNLYPSTATNGKILQGNGTAYLEVDLPSSINTNYVVLTYASSVNIDVSQTINNKYIEASGNFTILMVNKPALADGFEGELHVKKTTASDITITLDNLVTNVNYSGGTSLPSIVISGGLNLEEHIKFKYNKTTNKYTWEVLKYRTNHVKDITITGGGYTLSISDFDFTKNDQMFFVTTSAGQQDFNIPAGLAIPTGTNIIVCQVASTQLNIKKGNTTTVIFNPAGGTNSVGVQSTIYLASQNSMANITFKGSDTYYINGDILQ